jgi:hypothetical protein
MCIANELLAHLVFLYNILLFKKEVILNIKIEF